jgi:hypothetical protein
MKIDIRYLEGDIEMLNYAKEIRRQLVGKYGLNEIGVHDFRKEAVYYTPCEWPTIRYDLEEKDAARKLKPLVEKIAPRLNWHLLLVNIHLKKTLSPNRINLFLESHNTLSRISPAEQASKRPSCETDKD